MLFINKMLFSLFILFFFQTYFNIFISFIILFILFLLNFHFFLKNINVEKLKIIGLVILLVLSYIINILIHSFDSNLIEELKYIQFYRYDGRLFVLPILFLIFLFSIRLNFKQIVKIIIICSNILIIVSFVFFIYHPYNDYFSGPFKTHNALGGFVASLILLNFYFYNKYKNKIIILILATDIFFLILSASRTFLLALFIVFFINFLYFYRKYIFRFLFLILFLIGLTYIFDIHMLNRFLSPDMQDKFNIIFRLEAQKESFKVFLNNFLFGIGIGNIDNILRIFLPFKTETEIYKGNFLFSDINPHNVFLSILSEQGIIGLVLFIYVHLYILYRSYNYFPLQEFRLILNLFMMLTIAGLAGNSFFSPANAGIFYIILAGGINNYFYTLYKKGKK